MIYYLVTREHADTLSIYLQTWGRRLNRQLRAVFYDQLPHYRRLMPGMYIFADLERLTAAQMELARHTWRTLAAAGESARLLNDPSKVLRREPLLRELHRLGTNPFSVHGVDDDLTGVRYPVFVRQANEHDGSLSPPVHSPAQLTLAIQRALDRGIARRDLLVVEYCHTADAAGIFRKYSAFRVGERTFPRHLLISRDWVLKTPDIVDEAAVGEEQAYLTCHPHERELLAIFETANISYGRIDYSLHEGRVVTWEINTNPTITVEPARLAPARLAGQARFVQQFQAAMEAIDDRSGSPIPFQVPPDIRRSLGVRRRDRVLRSAGAALTRLGSRLEYLASTGKAHG